MKPLPSLCLRRVQLIGVSNDRASEDVSRRVCRGVRFSWSVAEVHSVTPFWSLLSVSVPPSQWVPMSNLRLPSSLLFFDDVGIPLCHCELHLRILSFLSLDLAVCFLLFCFCHLCIYTPLSYKNQNLNFAMASNTGAKYFPFRCKSRSLHLLHFDVGTTSDWGKGLADKTRDARSIILSSSYVALGAH